MTETEPQVPKRCSACGMKCATGTSICLSSKDQIPLTFHKNCLKCCRCKCKFESEEDAKMTGIELFCAQCNIESPKESVEIKKAKTSRKLKQWLRKSTDFGNQVK